MRSIVQYLRAHLRSDFSWGYYLTALGFIALCIAANYLTAPSGYRSWEHYLVRAFYVSQSPWCFPIYLGFYAFPYLVLAGITAFFKRDADFFGKKEFWLRLALIMLLLAAQASLGLHRAIGQYFDYPPDKYFAMRISAPLMPYLYFGVPLLFFWWWRDRARGVPFLYGLVRKGFDYRPYAIIVAIMFPIVLLAAFQPQFQDYYPTLQIKQIAENNIIQNEGFAFGLYEVVYGLYFMWAEIIFRGFLVVGMAHLMGQHAIMPMTGVYAFRHFAKPPGETISSIFGGFILGVIALRTNNIVGGVIVHGAVAVMMDLLAYFI
jgi:hypothetical protein